VNNVESPYWINRTESFEPSYVISDFKIETCEKPFLLSTRRQTTVILERSEESATQVMPFFRWKWLRMQGRSFAALEDDGCYLAMDNAGEVFRKSQFGFRNEDPHDHSEFRIPNSAIAVMQSKRFLPDWINPV